jgi:hypothetical protein
LERVIEQFFRHCQSLSSISQEQQQKEQQKEQQKQQKEQQQQQKEQQQQIQQRSVYDNLADEQPGSPPSRKSNAVSSSGLLQKQAQLLEAASNGSGTDWLHTKAKVVAQQNSGPVDWSMDGGGGRDGSPRRRTEMLMMTSSGGGGGGRTGTTYWSNGGAANGGPAAAAAAANGTGNIGANSSRKCSSVEAAQSRIPLPRASASLRQPNNGHSGNESSSSTNSSHSSSGEEGSY